MTTDDTTKFAIQKELRVNKRVLTALIFLTYLSRSLDDASLFSLDDACVTSFRPFPPVAFAAFRFRVSLSRVLP
jgi:hypothetical protein